MSRMTNLSNVNIGSCTIQFLLIRSVQSNEDVGCYTNQNTFIYGKHTSFAVESLENQWFNDYYMKVIDGKYRAVLSSNEVMLVNI